MQPPCIIMLWVCYLLYFLIKIKINDKTTATNTSKNGEASGYP